MTEESKQPGPGGMTRRRFLKTLAQGSALLALGGLTGSLLFRKSGAPSLSACGDCPSLDKLKTCTACNRWNDPSLKDALVWQIDPTRCVKCGRCETACVRKPSAVKAVHNFSICGYCDKCSGYFSAETQQLTTAAENLQCPTDALRRAFVEKPYYEYSVASELCIGCGRCVRGCQKYGNGSLYLQVHQRLCAHCNECSIARVCEGRAFVRRPASQPYILKEVYG